MQIQVKQIDFSGQNIYCGLDVHKRQVTVTVKVEGVAVWHYQNVYTTKCYSIITN